MANLYTLGFKDLLTISEELQALLIKRPFTVIESPTEIRPSVHRGLWLTQPVLTRGDSSEKNDNAFLIYANNLTETDKFRLEITPGEGNAIIEISLERRYAIITCHNKDGHTTVVYFITVDSVEPEI